jgi:hypothetical protein
VTEIDYFLKGIPMTLQKCLGCLRGVLVGVFLAVLTMPQSTATAQELESPKWEYKAVSFANDEEKNTKKLNELADAGWQYVGPLGNGMVAFRRPYIPSDAILVEVVANPKTVSPGEKTTLTVTVRAGDRSLLPGAKVMITAGGGKFLATANEPFDPKERLHSPYSATGLSNARGQFTTWWVVNPAAPGYGLSIDASKEGFTAVRVKHTIRIK